MDNTTYETERTMVLRKLRLTLHTGRLLMESMADTSRIERNMMRMADHLGLPTEKMHIFTDFHKLGLSLDTEDNNPITLFCPGERKGVNMAVINDVSHLSFKAIDEEYTVERCEEELKLIESRKRSYSPWLTVLGGGAACGGFCFLFGSDFIGAVYASLAAMMGLRLRQMLHARKLNAYFVTCVVTFFSTLIAWMLALLSQQAAVSAHLPDFLSSQTPWHPLMACTLFIIPGIPLINFVSDMLSGHTLVGIGRAVITLLTVLSMAFGIAFAIKVCGIDNFVHDLSMTPHHSYLGYSLGAATAAVGFSMLFNTPPRLLPIVALGGIVAVCTRNFVNLDASTGNIGLGLGPVLGSFAGSALVSLLCTRVVRQLNTPHHCISIPSVIPMVPGVLMYRALFAFIDMNGVVGEVTYAMFNAINASLIILFIAVGVAIPNIFFPRMMDGLPNIINKVRRKW